MRYSEIKRLVDELFRQFLRRVDKRLRNIENREIKIRLGNGAGDMPDVWGPSYIHDNALQIYKINIEFDGTGAAFNIDVEGHIVSEAVTELTEFPYFFATPIRWKKGEALKVNVNSDANITNFEAVLTARQI